MRHPVFSYSKGQGEDLVLLHGWGVNAGVWDALVTQLSSTYRVTCIDLPGFGRSAECLPEKYDLNSVCQMILSRIPEYSVLLGWSLGGLIASQLAINDEIPLRGLVTVASSPKFVQAENWPGIKANVLQAFASQLEGDFGKTLDRFLAIQAMGSQSARQDVKQLKNSISQHSLPAREALYGGLDILQTADLRPQLSRIQIPLLNCFGKLDTLVPYAAHQHIADYLPHAQQQVFAKAAHAPFMSDQTEFLKRLMSFLQRIPY